MSRKTFQLLIVDDHPMVIAGCRAILSAHMDVAVREAHGEDEGFERYFAKRPDAAIIDLYLTDGSGLALAQRILRQDPKARIIFFSMNDDAVFASRAIECGAKGYISKCESPSRFVAAIRAVTSGETFLVPEIAQQLACLDDSAFKSSLSRLNARELNILRHLREGCTMAEIAHASNLSYKTITNNCTALKRKLGARTLLDLTRIAIENKLA